MFLLNSKHLIALKNIKPFLPIIFFILCYREKHEEIKEIPRKPFIVFLSLWGNKRDIRIDIYFFSSLYPVVMKSNFFCCSMSKKFKNDYFI